MNLESNTAASHILKANALILVRTEKYMIHRKSSFIIRFTYS